MIITLLQLSVYCLMLGRGWVRGIDKHKVFRSCDRLRNMREGIGIT